MNKLIIAAWVLASGLVSGLVYFGVSRSSEAEYHVTEVRCRGLMEDARMSLDRAAERADRKEDNEFERGLSLGRITSAFELCGRDGAVMSSEYRARVNELVDERMPAIEIRRLSATLPMEFEKLFK